MIKFIEPMSILSLFPLNTVLFPGTPLRLHIFEPRYKLMIARCLERREPFGVLLIQSGEEALGPLAEPFSIGCLAEITQVEQLDDGRMNLIVVGKERFKVKSLDKTSEPYLTGEVEQYPVKVLDHEALERGTARLRRQVEGYLGLMTRSGVGQFDLGQLPEDPTALTWLAAALIQVHAFEKQAWLESREVEEALSGVLKSYRRELTLLKTILDEPDHSGESFSRN